MGVPAGFRGSLLVASVTGAAVLGGCLVVAVQDSDAPVQVVQVADAAPPVAGPTARSTVLAPATMPCEIADVVPPTWKRGLKVQDAWGHIADSLNARFTPGSKQDPYAQIKAGLLGIALDDAARQYVAVVDPGLVDVDSLDRDLKAAARAENERRPGVPEVGVRAQAGCYSAAEIVDALAVVSKVATSRDASGVHAYSPRAYDGRIEVDANAAGQAELRRRLGDRVSFDG